MKATFEPDFKSHISLVGGEIFVGEYLKDKSTPKFLYLISDISYLVFICPNRWYRPGGEGGNGPPEGKFMKLGGQVNFGVLGSKVDVIQAKRRAISLVLTNKASFSC